MRSILTWCLVVASATANAKLGRDEIEPGKQLALQEIRPMSLVIDGEEQVKGMAAATIGITWSRAGTVNFVVKTAYDEWAKTPLSRPGASAGGEVIYREWPYLLDGRGRVWAVDDSLKGKIRAKILRWQSARGWLSWEMATVAGVSVVVYALAYLDAQFTQIKYDTHSALVGWNLISPFLTGIGLITARDILFKRVHQLPNGVNFFNRELARNVESLVEEVNPMTSEKDARMTFKDGRSVWLSDHLRKDYNPKAPTYRFPTCVQFLLNI